MTKDNIELLVNFGNTSLSYLIRFGDISIAFPQGSTPELRIGKYIEVNGKTHTHHVYLEVIADIHGKRRTRLLKELQFTETRKLEQTRKGIRDMYIEILDFAYNSAKALENTIPGLEVHLNGMHYGKLNTPYSALEWCREDPTEIMNRFMRRGIEARMNAA